MRAEGSSIIVNRVKRVLCIITLLLLQWHNEANTTKFALRIANSLLIPSYAISQKYFLDCNISSSLNLKLQCYVETRNIKKSSLFSFYLSMPL